MAESLKLAVVTGGHAYDVVNFHRLFRAIGDDIDVYIQHMDDFASASAEMRRWYDVVLFYLMLMDGPADEGHSWYEGKPKTVLEELGQAPQGIVLLHHGILAYPYSRRWNELTGINGRSFGYSIGEKVTTHIANPDHAITRGLHDWTMTDETYSMPDAGPGSRVLLTTNHPKSMKTIAWTRQLDRSRVFNYQAGHDNETWQDESFRKVLRRGILWAGEWI